MEESLKAKNLKYDDLMFHFFSDGPTLDKKSF